MARRIATLAMVISLAAFDLYVNTVHADSSCGSDSDCAGYGRCSGGKCGSCGSDSDCKGGRCSGGRCSNAR